MNEVRELTVNESEFCRNFALSRAKIGGTKPPSPDKIPKFYTSEESNTDTVNIGYFEDNQLISWMTFGFYESKMRGKFWVIIGLYSTRQEKFINFVRPDIASLLSKAFEIAEGREYFQYFYCISERLERVYETQWAKKNPLNYHGRYDLTTLAVVPANTQPEFELFWRLMGQELKPDNIAIKARILKGYSPFDK